MEAPRNVLLPPAGAEGPSEAARFLVSLELEFRRSRRFPMRRCAADRRVRAQARQHWSAS